jgi:hypothetical protein
MPPRKNERVHQLYVQSVALVSGVAKEIQLPPHSREHLLRVVEEIPWRWAADLATAGSGGMPMNSKESISMFASMDNQSIFVYQESGSPATAWWAYLAPSGPA